MRAHSVWASFGYAWSGLRHVVRTQRNVRIQLALAAVLFAVAAWVGLPPRDWAVLVLTAGMVLVAEIANTAVETVVDLASPEYHELARIAKDVSAAAVLCVALTSVVVGALLVGPPLWLRIGGSLGG